MKCYYKIAADILRKDGIVFEDQCGLGDYMSNRPGLIKMMTKTEEILNVEISSGMFTNCETGASVNYLKNESRLEKLFMDFDNDIQMNEIIKLIISSKYLISKDMIYLGYKAVDLE